MKISNDIKVGVEYKKLCDFYSTLKEYVARFEDYYPDHENLTLFGLEICNEEGYIKEYYYVGPDINNLTMVLFCTEYTKEADKPTTHSEVPSSYPIMNELISRSKHVLDMDYFINNN